MQSSITHSTRTLKINTGDKLVFVDKKEKEHRSKGEEKITGCRGQGCTIYKIEVVAVF